MPSYEKAQSLTETAINVSSCRVESITSKKQDEVEVEACWICLEGPTTTAGLLSHPCRCPRQCHAGCIARWQLQNAGTRREKQCEFCGEELPSWQDAMMPPSGCSAPAIMNVNFNNAVHSFEVHPGPEGYVAFTSAIRHAFSLPSDSDLNITFTCDDPISGLMLSLQGAGAYDAAVHCAAISAARRTLASGPQPSAPAISGRDRLDRPVGSSSSRSSSSSTDSTRHQQTAAPRRTQVHQPDWDMRDTTSGGGLLASGWMLVSRVLGAASWVQKLRCLHHHSGDNRAMGGAAVNQEGH
ncbi:hypothetical protein CEUSTIGMA_g3443.t1 [Chlamydomonas eustigma]|uniref:RING-CH-type domain-containing protein n=1 Tax=Chlamydomonas eustigma TaxID=1157962 RepID=A0A250WZR6_9CHLO|nr:hypothetical protein CEUSTIGMA_g3443.t1 [Chlamydomonas eustigma]|eukprot:GAX76000.1 hypothetical protein CEUSTIGMA_g3443.t1 [Chlamydomonas eustigma]